MTRAYMLLASMLLASALAQQPVISPLRIVVNPTPAFDVEVWVDKDEAGVGTPAYEIGEAIRFGVRVSEDAFVYLFNLRSDGQIQQILPNRFDPGGQENFLRAGETRTFPPTGARYSFHVEPPEGLERVIAVASKRELSTEDLADFQRDAEFATARMDEGQFARSLAVVVEPVPLQDWVTDTALFYVGEPPAQPAFATLRIESTPRDAVAYVDGQFVGYTPVTFEVEPGEYRIRLEHPEFRDFETTATVAGGETQELRATLSQRERRGALLVSGNVGGALVTLDGEDVGRLADVTGELHVGDLRPGEYRLRVTAPGYRSLELIVSVRPDETNVVPLTLERTDPPRAPDERVFRHVPLEPYPGATIEREREEPDRLEVRFATRDQLDAVYGFFHDQLWDWSRTLLDVRPNRVTAQYVRGGSTLDLDLRRLGESGVYELTVEVRE